MDWIVYTYDQKSECHAYYAYDNSADDQAGVPFTQQDAEELAANINQFNATSGVHAMALPLEQTLQPGV